MSGRATKRETSIQFADEWDLDDPSKRRKHASLIATVVVSVKEPPPSSFFSRPPAERLPALKKARKNRARALAAALQKLGMIGVVSVPSGLRCKLRVRDLDQLQGLPGAGDVWIHHVEGLRRTPRKPSDEWFAVRGRVMIQVEGRERGLQTYEDRIVLVRARTFREAEQRALREFARYAKNVYLNAAGRMVRWKLEKIIDIYETDLENLDPNGTEVWSSLHSRRLRDEFVWLPGASARAREMRAEARDS